MKEDDVTRAITALRHEAEAATRTLPPPDVEALLARTRRVPRTGLVPRLAAAAAVVVVAAGVLWTALPSPVPEGDPPEYLVGLVDSLYSNESYLIDDIAGRWDISNDRAGNRYLDSVWADVIGEMRGAQD